MLPSGNITGTNRKNQAKDSRSGTIIIWEQQKREKIPAREYSKLVDKLTT
jgi:hypothetical protein